MTAPERRESVVVGLDGSPASGSAVQWAAAVARREHWRLRLVNAYPNLSGLPMHGFYVPEHELQAEARTIAEQIRRSLEWAGWDPDDVRIELGCGYPEDVLAEHSRGARMLVVGRRGRGGFVGMLMGSTAFGAAERAETPTVIVPEGWTAPEDDQRPVVIGLAGASDGTAAVDFAFDSALRNRVVLRAVQAFDPATVPMMQQRDESGHQEWRAGYERALAEELAGWGEKYPDVPVDRRVVDEHPVAALLEQARGAQLMVIGGRTRTWQGAEFLGSAALGLMHYAECPLAVVHSEA
jgi:nucleotide-binding universal stress UspA family protein